MGGLPPWKPPPGSPTLIRNCQREARRMNEQVLSRRTQAGRSGQRPTFTVVRAALCSLTLHVLFLGAAAVIIPLLPDSNRAPLRLANLWWAEPPIALTLADPALVPDEPEKVEPVTKETGDLPAADFANRDVEAARLSRGLPASEKKPLLADAEKDGRRRAADPSWRKDRTTLRDRLTDGARHHSPSREDTHDPAASAQAVRREPKVGIGDAARTTLPRQQLPEVVPPVLPEVPAEPTEAPLPPEASARAPLEPGEDDERGKGPLAADSGSLSFDLAMVGPTGDEVHMRAASDAMNPGVVDYARPTGLAAGDGAGRGPSTSPGVAPTHVSRVADATAPQGFPVPSQGREGGTGTAEMRYHREHLEVSRRIVRALVFPRDLLIRLEQGESIVEFNVEPNGQLAGDVRLVKSARFAGFDAEAVDAVRRAAPYPRLPQRMRFRVRIPFENPMVR